MAVPFSHIKTCVCINSNKPSSRAIQRHLFTREVIKVWKLWRAIICHSNRLETLNSNCNPFALSTQERRRQMKKLSLLTVFFFIFVAVFSVTTAQQVQAKNNLYQKDQWIGEISAIHYSSRFPESSSERLLAACMACHNLADSSGGTSLSRSP